MNNITYELCKKLHESGFKIGDDDSKGEWLERRQDDFRSGEPMAYYCPTLSELIEACGGYLMLHNGKEHWSAVTSFQFPDNAEMDWQHGSTPEEAVANLWLELNKK